MTQPPLPFSSDSQLQAIALEYGTPLYIHHENSYRRYAGETLNAPNAFGLSVRYAMKANPHRSILRLFDSLGIGIDASSYYEVQRALAAGIAPTKIQLSSQETFGLEQLKELVDLGIIYNCTSLSQLCRFAALFPQNTQLLSIRINPGLGSGHNNRTNTAGLAASFGIWHEYLPEILAIAEAHSLTISRLHSHVGSGSDWRIWQKAARLTLDVAQRLPDVTLVNLGGGYKIDRMVPENSMRFARVFPYVKEAFEEFAMKTGRQLHLEIEPGSFLAANSCLLVARVNDIVDTGAEGYRFLKIDASMTELLRPMIYGDRHPIRLLECEETASGHRESGHSNPRKSFATQFPYVIVSMCCESGDIFTPKQGNPDQIDTVQLPEAKIGDLVAVMGAGAYGAAMNVKHYNSRPACAEVMISSNGSHRLITRAETPEEIWVREL